MENSPSCVSLIRKALLRKGISGQAASVILDSWRESTRKQYWTHLQKWLHFSVGKHIDPLDPPVNLVLAFLTELFDSGLGYSSINTARSAISSLVKLSSNVDLGHNVLIKRFLRGVFLRRPCLPRYGITWDVRTVLQYLEKLFPLGNLSLKQVTQKLVTVGLT